MGTAERLGKPIRTAEQPFHNFAGYGKRPSKRRQKDGQLMQLTKAVIECALDAEMAVHLGYERYSINGHRSGNSRNGTSRKTIRSSLGEIEIEIPRDRLASFEPVLLSKGQTEFIGFEDVVLSLYARGMTAQEMQIQIGTLYRHRLSLELQRAVTEGIKEKVSAWQNRPLEEVYTILYMDRMMIRISNHLEQKIKAVYTAIGLTRNGEKEILGLWMAEIGARFWTTIFTELHSRGVRNILVVCVENLMEITSAIRRVYPSAAIQLCIAQMVRTSLAGVDYKERKIVAQDLKTIYRAASIEQAELQLKRFSSQWDRLYPAISSTWKRNWQNIVPFFAFPPELRQAIYAANSQDLEGEHLSPSLFEYDS